MSWLWVCLGAAVGAPLRYLADRVVQSRHDSVFPWGTFLVNLVGTLGLGALVGFAGTRAVGGALTVGLGVGFFGALTTYSTFGYETFRLWTAGARMFAVVNVVGSLALGFACAVLGYVLGTRA